MGEQTAIGWTHHTFNPWIGCTEVSPECDHCYARVLALRYGWVSGWGAGVPRHHTAASTWKQPHAWNRKAVKEGVRRRVFCASLADVFDVEVPDDWRAELMQLIEATPALDWLLLSKRPKVMAQYFDGRAIPPNVWAGTTVGTEKMAAPRIIELIKVKAQVRFLSMEPLLEWVDVTKLSPDMTMTFNALTGEAEHLLGYRKKAERKVDWVIAGGESGDGYRPMDPTWARKIRDQCAAAGVPFFFKQWGGLTPDAGGRLLDGVEHNGFPT